MSNSEFTIVPVSQIIVKRDERQRRKVEIDKRLADSIRQRGLFNPITVTREMVLIAGERRLEACRSIDPEYQIAVQFIDDLDHESQIMEYEENVVRLDLHWTENVMAIHQIHSLMVKRDKQWRKSQTGFKVGYSQQHVSKCLSVAELLLKKDAQIEKAESLTQALAIIARRDRREIDNLSNILSECVITESMPKNASDEENPKAPPIKEAHEIICADFTEWVSQYSGARFNLLHCDFPYGINHGKSAQGGTSGGRWEGYADGEDVYWQLLRSLADNIDRILLPSAHVMFWFSMKFYRETVDFFEKHTDLELVTPFPLIWQKSDGRGIIPDVTREPRRVYETALLLSRGDRRIIKPAWNACFLPSGKADAIHVSEKPVSVLKHFFELFVDEETMLLDPTCGSGSAIRAASIMGAKRALGLELNPDFAKDAQNELRQMNILKDILPQ